MSGPPVLVDDALLRSWPLPHPDAAGDKETRGETVVVAGIPEMPGAAWLAAVAALRAGAGKLVVATAASVAAGLALRLPEARVVALPETPLGGLAPEGVAALAEVLAEADALLVALARRVGPLGYLASELPGEIPKLMQRLAGREGATDGR